MKKIATTLSVLILLLLSPSLASAQTDITPQAAGEWDYLGNDFVLAARDFQPTKIFYSGGGDLKVNVQGFDLNTQNDSVNIALYNYDPGMDYLVESHNEQIGSNGIVSYTFHNLNFWVDGSNNKAEFKVVVRGTYSTWNNETVEVKVWD
jgi:hypothetical protein